MVQQRVRELNHPGTRLRALRKEHNDPVASIADALGVTRKQIWRYENGINDMPSLALYTLAERYGVTVDYFYQLLPRKDVTGATRGTIKVSTPELELVELYRSMPTLQRRMLLLTMARLLGD